MHWLQARAQRDRWREEFTLAGYEMEWTIRYYMHQCVVWRDRGDLASHAKKQGAAAYASRKTDMWQAMAVAAEKKFLAVNSSYLSLLHT